MPLTLYRRHLTSCVVTKSKLSPRAKRLAMDCHCPIWMYGRVGNSLVPRQSTGYTNPAEAERLRDSLIAKSKNETVHGPRIDECIQKYLASHKHELGEKTYGQYKLHLGRLQNYCEHRGVYFIRELNVDLLETFKVEGLPDLADTSKSTVVAKLRCFLRDAFRRGWITEPLVERVRPHRAVYDQKEPYSDEEVDKILNEALKLNGGTHGYARYPKTFRLLLELMLETGMRVGDAIRYNLSSAAHVSDEGWRDRVVSPARGRAGVYRRRFTHSLAQSPRMNALFPATQLVLWSEHLAVSTLYLDQHCSSVKLPVRVPLFFRHQPSSRKVIADHSHD